MKSQMLSNKRSSHQRLVVAVAASATAWAVMALIIMVSCSNILQVASFTASITTTTTTIGTIRTTASSISSLLPPPRMTGTNARRKIDNNPHHHRQYDVSCRQSIPNQDSSSSSSPSSSSSSSSSELSALAVPYQDGATPAEQRHRQRRSTNRVFEETTIRSAVKALVWRLVAGSITFVTSYSFSHSISEALTIVSSDFLSKSLTMFIGERLMNKSQAGRKSGGTDGAGRSLAKALLWRAFAIVNTMSVACFVSKDLSVASKIASTDAVFKTALMFAYERSWAKVQWGKVEV